MDRIPTWRLDCLIEVEAEDADWALERLRRTLLESAGMTLRRGAVADPATTAETAARSPLLALAREWEARDRDTNGTTT